MRRLIAMIARAFATVRTVLVKCRETGEWIIQHLTGGSAPVPMMEPDIDELDQRAAIDDTLAITRRVAADMAAGRMPSLEDLAAIHPPHLDWIRVMTPEMRAVVAGSTDDDLRAHIRGRRSIRSLLQADAESVEAYATAKRRQDVDDPDREDLPQPAYA